MLDKVTIGIKTFLRDGKLFRALDDIQRTMPEVKIIVADDGHHTEEKDGIYGDLVKNGHQVIQLPFDSGFGAKSNAIADALETEYLLVGSDDFDFAPPSVREGIENLTDILDTYPNFDIVSGRVNNRPYEFRLVEENGVVTEIPVLSLLEVDAYSGEVKADLFYCDLTVNYSLIRRRVFEKVRWDDDVKIGQGEHAAFFIDVKRAGFGVGCFAGGANINEQVGSDDPVYRNYRRRALGSERICFNRRGVRKYVMANGIVDYEKKF